MTDTQRNREGAINGVQEWILQGTEEKADPPRNAQRQWSNSMPVMKKRKWKKKKYCLRFLTEASTRILLGQVFCTWVNLTTSKRMHENLRDGKAFSHFIDK
eukprot:CAMPEP_0178786412 /NCGR_PEP_ID=MMETSP0745-20121128/5301_1 /TAXON_ID=913974 /ORGANISM="Nitzschia punctata, Strain CCMP561" /LENGTH=100 /DNA_ID=CAMNT_0020444181 /DNA_START=150 /DNA_END=449 /DNA_ORIENTATION=-